MFRETVAYTGSAVYSCTTNNQSWTATRDTQPIQSAAAPPVGSYTGTNPQTGNPTIAFDVSSNKSALQDISIPDVYMTCAPGAAVFPEPLWIASAAIESNGSFGGTMTQAGDYAGYQAMFTYNFSGNFHSVGPSGAERAAGTFRETMTYTSTAAYSCTSANQSWTATRDTQPIQTASPPPAGGYTGTNPQTGNPTISFNVSSSKTAVQNISIPDVHMTCAPGGANIAAPLGIASATLEPNGSFSATTTQGGLIGSDAATFTYTFSGNFHSVGPSGQERAAGMFRETVTYTGNVVYSCTSNNQAWTASFT